MKITVEVINKQKQTDTKGLKTLIKRTCAAVLGEQNFTADAFVSVSLVDNQTIKQINSEFRRIDKETDVLSFPLGENGEYDVDPDTGEAQLGDIVISLEKAVEQAQTFGHSKEREVSYLTAHSMLHLLGYDHVNGGDEQKIMRAHEDAVMEILGLAL